MSNKSDLSEKEQPIMTYKQKLLEVPIQVGLLFVSVIVQVSALLFLLYGYYVGKIIVSFFIDCLKNGGYNSSYWRYAEEEDGYYGGYYETKTYDIKNSDGESIGTCETRGDYVPREHYHYDAGWKLVRKDIEEDLWALVCLALPLRIISLFSSLLALFIPKLYVSARTPVCEKKPIVYKEQLNDLDTNKIYGTTQNVYGDAHFLCIDLIIINK